MATRGNPSWQQRFDAQVPPSAKISLKKHWVAENGNADGRAVLAAREISLRSWLCLLCSEQKLPRVHCRDDVLWTLLVDLYLVYLVIREGLRVTKGGEPLQIADVKFSGRTRRAAEVVSLSEWQRLAKTRNPIVECGGRVRDSSMIGVCRSMQLHNILPDLDPMCQDLAEHYKKLWAVIGEAGLCLVGAKLALLLTMFPALRGRQPAIAQFCVEAKLLLTSLEGLTTFLRDYKPELSRLESTRAVGDQRTSETRMGKNLHPKVEAMSILWDHHLDRARISWFSQQSERDLTSQESINILMQEKAFGGTGFAAKNIIVGLSVCDRVSQLRLFPGLQGDQDVCGPNPREFFERCQPGQDPEECLARFSRRAAARLPPKVVVRDTDVTSNLAEAVRWKKWTQLNLGKFLSVEEARHRGSYGANARRGQDEVAEVSESDAEALPGPAPQKRLAADA